MPNRQQRRHPSKNRVAAEKMPRQPTQADIQQVAREAGVSVPEAREMLKRLDRDGPFGYQSHWSAFLRKNSVALMRSSIDEVACRLTIHYHLEPPDKIKVQEAWAPWIETLPDPP